MLLLLLLMVVKLGKVAGCKRRRSEVGRKRGQVRPKTAARSHRMMKHAPVMMWRHEGRHETHPVVMRGHEVQLMDPLLLAALVLEPDLDDPHGKAGLLGQLLAHQPRRLRVLIEAGLQHFQLFCLDRRPRTATLPILALLLVAVPVSVVHVVVRLVRQELALVILVLLVIGKGLAVVVVVFLRRRRPTHDDSCRGGSGSCGQQLLHILGADLTLDARVGVRVVQQQFPR